MHSVAVVADDLTGAMDTAQGFAARGYGTAVVVDPSAAGSAGALDEPVVAINADSRYADPSAARDAVANAVTAAPARVVYKKVDSTLRGNLVPEVEAALSASGAAVALVAPAFPATGRTTEGGVHRVRGTPVAETEHADDPTGPTSSSLADLFADAAHPVEAVPLDAVAAGSDRVAAVVGEAVAATDRPPILVCDATTADHLEAIAAAGSEFDALYVGSGGLAERVRVPGASSEVASSADDRRESANRASGSERSDRHASSADDRDERSIGPGAPLGVVGSVNETTLAQLARVPGDTVIELDGAAALAGGDEATRAGSAAADRLRRGEAAVLTAATDRDAVERALSAGAERGLGDDAVRERIAGTLAAAAGVAVDEGSPSGLLATGGDVAVDVLRELGATGVRLTGRAVEDGVPVGRLLDGPAAGTPLVTKAGGFGSESTLVDALDLLDGG
ncbi:four-carbon acid sugar kinase family protein [Halomicrobium urmianum]|uniref:four-carbon acid sugar kinase family protein n=1 Tax=Halomicrobium urmianum TaxID=1586233 RepID=UPI001CD9BFC3|nr:four-carbon acid sugar kinase family protein [Halomicrobium urmianum]